MFLPIVDYYKYTTPFEGEDERQVQNVPDVKEVMKNPGKSTLY